MLVLQYLLEDTGVEMEQLITMEITKQEVAEAEALTAQEQMVVMTLVELAETHTQIQA